jgi:hypothetical protein
MPYEVADAVKAVSDDNTSVFQDAINSILADRLRERIGVEKVAVAQSFFNEPEFADETPEEEFETEIDGESDEDV